MNNVRCCQTTELGQRPPRRPNRQFCGLCTLWHISRLGGRDTPQRREILVVYARKFNQATIRPRTRGVGMVVNFVDANVARDSFLGAILIGARAPCTQNDCMYCTCATGLHESGIKGATAETATVLVSSL
jgi:hypothetical protein